MKQWGEGERSYLLLHGWGGSHKTFLPIRDLVPETARVFVPDLPGYGESTVPPELVLEDLAESLISMIPFGNPLTILGNCTGGGIAAEIARIHPEKIDRMVILDPFAFAPWYFKIFFLGEFGRNAYKTTFASKLGRYVTNKFLSSKRSDSTDLTASFEHVNHDLVYRFLRMMASINPIERYSGINNDVHILYGERTFSAVKKSVDLLLDLWPNSKAQELSGVGHLPIEESPDLVARAVFKY
jgi:pimeloyl-ACP methyl ester carboxylesterase